MKNLFKAITKLFSRSPQSRVPTTTENFRSAKVMVNAIMREIDFSDATSVGRAIGMRRDSGSHMRQLQNRLMFTNFLNDFEKGLIKAYISECVSQGWDAWREYSGKGQRRTETTHTNNPKSF